MLTFGLPCWPLAYHVGLWPTMLTFGLYNIDLWPLPCWPLAYHVDFLPTMVSLGLPCWSLTYSVDLLPTMVTFSLPCWPLVGHVLTFGLYNFDLWPLPCWPFELPCWPFDLPCWPLAYHFDLRPLPVPCWPLAYHADLWLTMLIFGLPCWPLAYHVDLWPTILYVDQWTPDNRLTIVFLYTAIWLWPVSVLVLWPAEPGGSRWAAGSGELTPHVRRYGRPGAGGSHTLLIRTPGKGIIIIMFWWNLGQVCLLGEYEHKFEIDFCFF